MQKCKLLIEIDFSITFNAQECPPDERFNGDYWSGRFGENLNFMC
jgi:hypothetical protein